mmetsp:Transcript_15692/g.22368  ORF Transcript_15692/g.22368 Transcript_15692/m.22368 type:complete len:132 (-) Transcript_15692:680-1075(-)
MMLLLPVLSPAKMRRRILVFIVAKWKVLEHSKDPVQEPSRPNRLVGPTAYKENEQEAKKFNFDATFDRPPKAAIPLIGSWRCFLKNECPSSQIISFPLPIGQLSPIKRQCWLMLDQVALSTKTLNHSPHKK